MLVFAMVAATCGSDAGGSEAISVEPMAEAPDIECLYRADLLISEKTDATRIETGGSGDALGASGLGASLAIVDQPGGGTGGLLQDNPIVLAERLDAGELDDLMTVEDEDPTPLEAITNEVDVWRVVDEDLQDSLQIALALENEGIDATPVLAFQLAGHWTFAPGADRVRVAPSKASEFEPAAAPADPARNVAVVDTGGVAADAAKGMRLLDDALDAETLDSASLYRGHGTFVASLIRAVDPDAVTTLVRLGPTSASTFRGPEPGETLGTGDVEFASDELQLLHAVARLVGADLSPAPTVLNVSGGTYGCGDVGITVGSGDDETVAPMAEWAAAKMWSDDSDGGDMVAAAGNDNHVGPSEPDFFPASLANVQGVASADDGGTISSFSNKGDICARGEDVIGYTTDGIFSWSGTSFAAPIVSGLIGKSGTVPSADDNKAACVSGDTVAKASVAEVKYCTKVNSGDCSPID